jgi:hypothetical protein
VASETGEVRIDPVILDPSCFGSRKNSLATRVPPAEGPYQVPVTSTVTSVRSIQSVFAQPAVSASKVAKSSTAMGFIASPRW